MIHDAKVEVTCDGARCHESIEISLPFTYPDLSGRNGRYDHRPRVVNPLVEDEGWTVVGDDTHYCENCAEQQETCDDAEEDNEP